jgi:hypothetical protein
MDDSDCNGALGVAGVILNKISERQNIIFCGSALRLVLEKGKNLTILRKRMLARCISCFNLRKRIGHCLQLRVKEESFSVACHGGSDMGFFSGGRSGSLSFIDLIHNSVVANASHGLGDIRCIQISNNFETMLSLSSERISCLWSVNSFGSIDPMSTVFHDERLINTFLHPSGLFLVNVSSNRRCSV